MVATPRTPSFWQSVKRLPERTPLRIKLITALLVLVSLALVVISIVSIAILKSDLLAPVDTQLSASFNGYTNYIPRYLDNGTQGSQTGVALDWVANGRTYHVVEPSVGLSTGGPGPNGFPHPPSIMSGPAIQTGASWLVSNSGHPLTLDAQSGPGRWRVLIGPWQFPTTSGGTVAGTVVLAVDVTSIYKTIGQLATIDLLVSLGVIVLLGILGIALIRTSLRPLTEIEQTAGAIAAGDLTRRVPDRDPRTEVGRLGRSLNAMLSQIEAAFRSRSESEEAARRSEERMRQFVADASHELRTPLTAIRGFAEYYRQRGGLRSGPGTDADSQPVAASAARTSAQPNGTGNLAPTDLNRIMRRVEQESARMGVLVEDMLLLARLDQQRPLDRSTVDLLTLAADAVHDARVVAPGRSINLTVGAGAALLVNGDEVRLRQVIGNLMSNALSHTPDGTPIEVLIRSGTVAEVQAATASAAAQLSSEDQMAGAEAVADSGEEAASQAWPGAPMKAQPRVAAEMANAQSTAVLEVTDHGPGMTEEQVKHAFERFYRADQARTSGGAGLGLAIVAALVSAHGGAVWVRSQPGNGATFSIALPLAPEAVQEAGFDEDVADPEIADSSGPSPDDANALNPDDANAGNRHGAKAGQDAAWIESGPPGGSTA